MEQLWGREPAGPSDDVAKTFLFAQARLSWVSLVAAEELRMSTGMGWRAQLPLGMAVSRNARDLCLPTSARPSATCLLLGCGPFRPRQC